jgi:hypothetical protein
MTRLPESSEIADRHLMSGSALIRTQQESNSLSDAGNVFLFITTEPQSRRRRFSALRCGLHVRVENELRPATERLEALPPDLRVER